MARNRYPGYCYCCGAYVPAVFRHFSSDTEETYEIILTHARRVKYELPDGRCFEDTGETGIDYFEIYGNAVEEDDWEEN